VSPAWNGQSVSEAGLRNDDVCILGERYGRYGPLGVVQRPIGNAHMLFGVTGTLILTWWVL
jgi:hypothetical protein